MRRDYQAENRWLRNAVEQIQMRDEGDMIAGPAPLTVRQIIVRVGIACVVIYALLTAALVLVP